LAARGEGVSLTAWPRGGKGCHSPLGREGSFALLVVEPAPASASASAPACRAPRGGDRRAGGGLAPDPVIGERQRLPPAALVAVASRHTAVAAAARRDDAGGSFCGWGGGRRGGVGAIGRSDGRRCQARSRTYFIGLDLGVGTWSLEDHHRSTICALRCHHNTNNNKSKDPPARGAVKRCRRALLRVGRQATRKDRPACGAASLRVCACISCWPE
jgi:hypothetical protein